MKLSQIYLVLVVFFSCKNDDEIVLPSIKTNAPSAITFKSVTLGGALTVKGSAPIGDHGFIWSTSVSVSETTGTMISLGERSENGSFEANLNGLNRGGKYYYLAYVIANNKFYLGNEIEFTAGAHTITSVSPASASAGSKITILGSDFVSDPSRIVVSIGGLNAPVITATETQIEVALPLESSGGGKSLKVRIDDIEVSFSSNISVIPVIENFSKSWGFAGDTVEILGSGFGNISEVLVKLNNKNVTVTSANFNKINFIVPSNSGGANSTSVSVNSVSLSNPIIFNVLAWRKLKDLPFVGRRGSTSFIINDKLYVGLGASLDNVVYKDFWQVDLQSGAVTKLGDFPGEARFANKFFTLGDKGYIVLGYGKNAIVNELWEFNPGSDSWTMKSPFPGQLRSGTVSFVLNGKAYVGCGIANGITSLDDFYQYDPELEIWEPVADFGGGPIYGQGSFVIDNKAYLVAGVKNNSTLVSELWEFDGSGWRQRASYPGQLITDGFGFNYGGFGCFGFGWIGSNDAGIENWKYKPSSNYWKKVENFSGPPRFDAASGSSEKYWYFGLGYKGNTEYSDIWIVELP